jgi:hypothetical protein
MKVVVILIGLLVGLVLLIWLGLKVKPAPFPPYPGGVTEFETIPLPPGLPAPVERFYRQVYSDRIPIITSAVISGRAEIRPFAGITLPARFRFIHEAGKNYRHYIEATFFGFPIMKVNERYVDGLSKVELPFGVTDEGPKVEQAANLGLWAETMTMPAVFLTDPRVRWEPFDDDSALLIVPFKDGEDRFVVRFDPESGLVRYMEAMRYRDSKSARKSLWITENAEWASLNGQLTGVVGAATWFEDGSAWAVFTTEEVVFNVDVQQYVRQRGY